MGGMAQRSKHIVVIGASSGGIEALRTLVADLPEDFPAPIAIVLHMSPDSPGLLADILSRPARLPVVTPRNGERLASGRIYVAPPDRHLVLEPGRLRVTKGPKENRFRPAIDPLFRSAAQVFGPGAIGVILTGNLGDGTAGLWAIKRLGGVTVVQDPDDALFPSMPRNAIESVQPHHVVPLSQIAPLLACLTATEPQAVEEVPVPDHMHIEVNIAKEQNPMDAGLERIARPSSFACPECHGVLLQLDQEGRIRFRCHTGHAYSIESLLNAIGEGIDEALWNAIRALEEGTLLMRQMSSHLATHDPTVGRDLEKRAHEAHAQAESVRKVASSRQPVESS